MSVVEASANQEIDPWLMSLPTIEVAALEGKLIEKNERLCFRCPVRSRDILANPEECARQLWLPILQATAGIRSIASPSNIP
jgi:hypothetical protein